VTTVVETLLQDGFTATVKIVTNYNKYWTMSDTPPPYNDITGISRAVMKDNAQVTLANYDGNARPGELVVNLEIDPPALYIGNNQGQLTAISTVPGPYADDAAAAAAGVLVGYSYYRNTGVVYIRLV
jgi:hypothetical protein